MSSAPGTQRRRRALVALLACASCAAVFVAVTAGGDAPGRLERSRGAGPGRADGAVAGSTEPAPARRRDPATPAAAGAPPGAGAGEAVAAAPPTRDLVDLYVLAGDGAGYYEGGARDLDPRVAFWVAPAIVHAGPRDGARPRVIEWPMRGRASGEVDPGWYGRFPRPVEPAAAAVLFGEAVVARAPLDGQSDRATLRVDLAGLEALACSVELRIGAPPLGADLRLVPRPAGFPRGRELEPDGLGADGSARFEALPPGPAVLRCSPSPIRLAAAARALAGERGVEQAVRWPHLPSAESLGLHLEAACAMSPASFELELELRPGDRRDLGTIEGEPAGAVILRLTRDGAPADARRSQASVIGGGSPPILMDQGDRLVLIGPRPGEARLHVSPARGAAVSAGYALVDVRFAALRPGATIPEVTCELTGPAFVTVPTGAGLLAPDGRPVPEELMSAHGESGRIRRFRGPAGRYVITLENGDAHVVDLAPWTAANAADGVPSIIKMR